MRFNMLDWKLKPWQCVDARLIAGPVESRRLTRVGGIWGLAAFSADEVLSLWILLGLCAPWWDPAGHPLILG